MRVLLTGASGFLGRFAATALAGAGHEVHGVGRGSAPDDARLVWHSADLTDADQVGELVQGVDAEALLHLAWYVEHGSYWEAGANLDWAAATLRLLRAFAEHGGRRAVLTGTCAEYEWSQDRYDEERAPLRPATLYGTAKHATHLVARAYAERAGLALAWARLFFPYGPGEPLARLLPSVAQELLAGRPAPAPDGEQIRDLIYVEDAAAALVAILDSGVGGAVNVGTGQATTIRDLLTCAGEEIGHPELIRWGELPPREGDPPALVAEVARLRDEVGFTPAVDLAEGVGRTVAWLRAGGS